MKKKKSVTNAQGPKVRYTKYKEEYCEKIVKFFSVEKNHTWVKKEKTYIKKDGSEIVEKEYDFMANEMPTFEKFARKIGVNGDTVVEWANGKYPTDYKDKKLAGKYKHPEFRSAYNIAKALQKEFLVDNGLAGLYPPASFIFVSKNVTDMRDKTETDLTSGGDKIEPIVIYKPEKKSLSELDQ